MACTISVSPESLCSLEPISFASRRTIAIAKGADNCGDQLLVVIVPIS
jgi:hypothetical protein